MNWESESSEENSSVPIHLKDAEAPVVTLAVKAEKEAEVVRCPAVWKVEDTAEASTVEAKEAGSGANAANSSKLLNR